MASHFQEIIFQQWRDIHKTMRLPFFCGGVGMNAKNKG